MSTLQQNNPHFIMCMDKINAKKPEIYLTDLSDKTVFQKNGRQPQILNSEASGGLLGGKSEPPVIYRLWLTEDINITIILEG